jgi:hypothetical protein
MTEDVQKKFLLWSYNEILKNVWAQDQGYEQRMAKILARANMGSMILLGTDEQRDELFNGLTPEGQQEILNFDTSV